MVYPFAPDPDALSDRELEAARWSPERETLELAAAGAAKVLGVDHGATKALAKAALTMAPPRHTARGPSLPSRLGGHLTEMPGFPVRAEGRNSQSLKGR